MRKSEQSGLSPRFEQLLAAKRRFLIPTTLAFLSFYFALPVCTSFFPQWMNRPVYGAITLAWMFAFAQFFMTLLLSLLYMHRAKRFDRMVDEIVRREWKGDRE
jgi:uncharacterized membrane protein (DUF485 family)